MESTLQTHSGADLTGAEPTRIDSNRLSGESQPKLLRLNCFISLVLEFHARIPEGQSKTPQFDERSLPEVSRMNAGR